MSNTDKVFGQGGNFAIGGTTVVELTSIGLPGMSSDDIDVTTHAGANYARDFIKGLTDAGEVPIEGYFTYNDYSTLYAQQWTTSLQSCTITLPTSPSETQLLFNGYLKGLDGVDPFDDKIELSATAKISGKPTLQQV